MRGNQRGVSLVEVLAALALVFAAVFTMLRFSQSAFRTSRHNMDRQFAIQKAISMLEELKSLAQVQGSAATALDAYDDGASLGSVLTTDRGVTDPASPVSNNTRVAVNTWKYLRQVTVSLLPGTADPDVRLVNVRVCLNRDDNGDGRPDSLAEVAGVIRTPAGNFPPTQVYDVYALAIANVPGWWVYMANLIPFVQNAVQNIETRNPGLELRVHWITKLAYGRDQQYRPQINSAVDSRQPINNVYFYPGRMPSGEAVSYYYPPDNFGGHVLVDNADTNGYDAASNPNPYALADMYNNAMRYPDELALFNARVASGRESDDAPTLRILLERLHEHPEQFRNAIFINLHGELFPFPPVRNYSDPAKEPAGYPGVRVVTHPERIRYPASAASVKLRVYSYRTDPDASPAVDGDWLGQNTSEVPITVTLKGVHWTPAAGSSDIVKVVGGTDQDGTAGPDAYAAQNATTAASGEQMYYTASIAGADTVIRLYNSPLKAPEIAVSGSGATTVYQGMNSSMRLYGMTYIPAPSEDLTVSGSPPAPFTSNLATARHLLTGGVCSGAAGSDDCTPNTARWIITVPAGVLPGGAGGNGMLAVETRIDSTTSGTRTDNPPNLSTTYVWRGSDIWAFGDGTGANPPHLPVTERYQIIGDPRHNPYADLKMPHDGSGLPLQDPLGMGYNRYFDDFENATLNAAGGVWWKGYTYTVSGQSYGVKNDGTAGNDGFTEVSASIEIDMNRVFQIMRNVLGGARAVWTTMTGYSYYYCGIGNDIGYDTANGFPNSIPIDNKLFTGTSGSTHEQEILSDGANAGVKYIRENTGGSPYWWGLYWLGELYPDSAYATWASTGNLPTGIGSGTFIRVLRENIASRVPLGTTLVKACRRGGGKGSTAFYWSGTSSSTFHHVSSNGTGDLQAGGTEVASRYNFPISNGIPINRPFDIAVNATGNNPDHFLQAPYGPVHTAAYLSRFYDHSVQTGAAGAALLSLAGSGDDVLFMVVNGISMTGESGTSFIANWSLLTLVQAFLQSGRYSAVGTATHVDQLARISITSPNATTDLVDPSSITVGWSREWLRWDGQSYTSSYPSGYSESSALSYTVSYSSDNGATWKYMQDGSSATPGLRPSSSPLLIATASANPTYDWSVPAASFPHGTYLIRVEAYRDDLPMHYAYHQYRVFIRRS